MTSKSFYIIGLAVLGLATTTLALSFRPISPSVAAPTTEMLRLATSSEFAIVGRVVNTTVISKRLSDEELIRLNDLSKVLGGTLDTIQVEEVVIKRADFVIDASPPPSDDKILIFKKRGAPYSPNELYVKGQRYLIFLKPIPEQSRLPKEYKLDAGDIYYQAFDPDKGVIPITNNSQAFLMKLRQLGEAVRPANPRLKLERLKILARSRDADLRQNAVEAIKLIQQNSRH